MYEVCVIFDLDVCVGGRMIRGKDSSIVIAVWHKQYAAATIRVRKGLCDLYDIGADYSLTRPSRVAEKFQCNEVDDILRSLKGPKTHGTLARIDRYERVGVLSILEMFQVRSYTVVASLLHSTVVVHNK